MGAEAGSPAGTAIDQDLVDLLEARPEQRYLQRVAEADRVCVVLGRSNRPEAELHEAACREAGVPILRRRGGGGAVVLAPGVLVLSLAARVSQPLAVQSHLRAAAAAVGDMLRQAVRIDPVVRGSGDLCVGDRKILGASLFRRRDLVFYQASLLVAPDLSLLPRFLRHPSREPEYRRGRPHAEFVTSLQQLGWRGTAGDLRARAADALAAVASDGWQATVSATERGSRFASGG